MKILILILTCRLPLYLTLESVIDQTWNSIQYPNIETYYYYGNSKHLYNDNRNIYLKNSERYHSITARTIECFEYCLEHFDFNYILRTNNSSYINKRVLYNFVEKLPETIYGGVIGNFHGIKYASGAGMLISKDNIYHLVKNKDKINYNFIDDVAIGNCLNKINTILPIKRYDFDCDLNLPDNSCFDTTYHFRCKCEYNRNNDILIMNKIHNFLSNYSYENK